MFNARKMDQIVIITTVICLVIGQTCGLAPNVESHRLVENTQSVAVASDNRIECGSDENLHQGQFSGLDYTIVIGMLVISLGIGIFYGFFNKNSSETSADFLLGSHMTLFPVTLSLTTSFITAIELLGNPSEMFFSGTQFSIIVIPIVFVIPVAVKVFYPIYFKLELTSCYEYLGIRFGIKIRVFGAILYIIQMSFYTSVAVLAPAIALSKATGLHTHIAVGLIYLVCIFYSSQGGMKAVVIADTFQACVLALSLILVLALGHFYTGDVADVFTIAEDRGRLEFLNFDPNPTTRHTVWSILIGGFFYWTSMFCTNQASVQKCMSLRSLPRAKKALIYSVLGLVIVFLINFYTGLLVFKQYANCDPLKAGEIVAKDQLLPFYIMDVFHDIDFLTGTFVAGIFAASLGTVASALSSLAAVTSEDLIDAAFNIKMDSNKAAFYAKWMSLGYGCVSFFLVFIVERLGGILQATLTLNGLIGGVTLGLFLLGIFFKRANSGGVLIGGVTTLVIIVFIGVMAQIKSTEPEFLSTTLIECNCYVNSTKEQILEEIMKSTQIDEVSPIFRLSYMWYSCLSTVLTILLGLSVSYVVSFIETKTTTVIFVNSVKDVEKMAKTKNDDNKTCEVYVIEQNEKLTPTIEGNVNLAFEK